MEIQVCPTCLRRMDHLSRRSKPGIGEVLPPCVQKHPKLTESETRVYTALLELGFKVYRGGWPDFLIEKDGQYMGVEVKREDNLNRDQKIMLIELSEGVGLKIAVLTPYDNILSTLENPRLLDWVL